MSKISKYAAILALSIAMTPAMAAEISDKGAQDIQEKLTRYLPKSMAESGFLKVTPEAGRYRMNVDLDPLIQKIKRTDFVITGLEPFVQYLTPQDDDLWRIEASQNLDIKIEMGAADAKIVTSYKIDKMDSDGLFDPSISYFKDLKTTATNVVTSTQGGGLKTGLTIASIEQTIKTTKLDDSHVDMVATGTMNDLKQAVTAGEAGGEFGFNIESASFDVGLKNFNIIAFRDLVVFVLDHMNESKLTTENNERLKGIVRANLPLGEIDETIKLSNLRFPAAGKEASLGEMIYKLEFSGFTQNATIGLDVSGRDLVLPPGLLPKGSEVALPQSSSFGVALTGLNLEGAATYFLDHADFSSEEPLTPTEQAAISKIILPDGKLHVEFRNVAVKSAHYDIEMSGSMVGYPETPDRMSADITIYSRDLDKTIKFLQSSANTIPEFGMAATSAQMMKGFAKQAADGRYYWNLTLSEDGKAKVNGRDLPQQ